MHVHVYFKLIKVSVKLSIMELYGLSVSLLVLQTVKFISEFQRRHTCCTNHGHLICFVKHATLTYISRILLDSILMQVLQSDCRGRNVPDCLPVSSDRQNIFLPVSTSIQLEQ